jgi:6-pyruvoyltetrahydropterin/6-carboxytetrahydropterin synthase
VPTRIVKRFSFEAAHQLPNHDGACRRLHGHGYVVEVAVTGPLDVLKGSSSEGMVMDFSVVKAAFTRRVFDRLDHQYLNDVLADEVPVTTAEHLANWILEQMRQELNGCGPHFAGMVEWVRVWETATSYAEAS